jgi:lipopolysaccharide biosynthesis glycosyltransferase
VASAVRRAASPFGASFDVLIFVPADDVTDAHRGWAAARCVGLRHDVDTSFVRDIPILQSRLSTATLVKLLLAEHLSGTYDKILYLDADLVIAGDVSALFRLEMGVHAVAAVPSGRLWIGATKHERSWRIAHMEALGMTPPYRYFNSGVILISVESWNREQLTRRTLEFIRKHADICFLPDEDALNGVLYGDVLELSPIWNAQPRSRLSYCMETRSVIVHYDGPLKPWIRFKKGKGLFQDIDAFRLYEDFVRNTPWSGWLRQQWTFRDLVLALRREAKGLLKRLIGMAPALSEAERRSRQAIVREYYAQSRFADVEQGITLREGSRLYLAPALPPAPGDGASVEQRGLALDGQVRNSAPARP